MRIACIGYREWAFRIYDAVMREPGHVFMVMRGKESYDEQALLDFKPDLVLFYGWSWVVGKKLLDAHSCLMLHPAPLPKYRGGSPIQNQIIDGQTDSAVTIFVMTEALDAGDIAGQCPLSLEGTLDDIFDRITEAGIRITLDILRRGLVRTPQDSSKATYCKRRKPADSELTLDELASAPGQHLYNKIRMLADPYPNAFIRTKDGGRLLIKAAEFEPPSA
jgi:methionyl-tRNA formyltransferase